MNVSLRSVVPMRSLGSRVKSRKYYFNVRDASSKCQLGDESYKTAQCLQKMAIVLFQTEDKNLVFSTNSDIVPGFVFFFPVWMFAELLPY